jgi:hypothetical protein
MLVTWVKFTSYFEYIGAWTTDFIPEFNLHLTCGQPWCMRSVALRRRKPQWSPETERESWVVSALVSLSLSFPLTRSNDLFLISTFVATPRPQVRQKLLAPGPPISRNRVRFSWFYLVLIAEKNVNRTPYCGGRCLLHIKEVPYSNLGYCNFRR